MRRSPLVRDIMRHFKAMEASEAAYDIFGFVCFRVLYETVLTHVLDVVPCRDRSGDGLYLRSQGVPRLSS